MPRRPVSGAASVAAAAGACLGIGFLTFLLLSRRRCLDTEEPREVLPLDGDADAQGHASRDLGDGGKARGAALQGEAPQVRKKRRKASSAAAAASADTSSAAEAQAQAASPGARVAAAAPMPPEKGNLAESAEAAATGTAASKGAKRRARAKRSRQALSQARLAAEETGSQDSRTEEPSLDVEPEVVVDDEVCPEEVTTHNSEAALAEIPEADDDFEEPEDLHVVQADSGAKQADVLEVTTEDDESTQLTADDREESCQAALGAWHDETIATEFKGDDLQEPEERSASLVGVAVARCLSSASSSTCPSPSPTPTSLVQPDGLPQEQGWDSDSESEASELLEDAPVAPSVWQTVKKSRRGRQRKPAHAVAARSLLEARPPPRETAPSSKLPPSPATVVTSCGSGSSSSSSSSSVRKQVVTQTRADWLERLGPPPSLPPPLPPPPLLPPRLQEAVWPDAPSIAAPPAGEDRRTSSELQPLPTPRTLYLSLAREGEEAALNGVRCRLRRTFLEVSPISSPAERLRPRARSLDTFVRAY
eukprot:TRINITY_DN65390_c0_g1_i1.p1 TRINITY_DN65390_c0_g1~~TRINITY_DN65390_c0_g1_i1.p1  ORF type:complete len:535 (-),score=114.25 TRINITY_DN65390_c0_g1_i1:321-1925(-)